MEAPRLGSLRFIDGVTSAVIIMEEGAVPAIGKITRLFVLLDVSDCCSTPLL